MADENNEKKTEDKIELSLDDLEGAAGGYVVQRDSCGGNRGLSFAIVDDETGERLRSANTTEGAERYSDYLGVSGEVISEWKYEQMFGKKLQ